MTTPLLDIDGRMVDRRQEMTELRDAVDAAGTRWRRMRPAQRGSGSGQVNADTGIRRRGFAAQLCFRLREVPGPRAGTVHRVGRCAHLACSHHGGTGPAERDRWHADLVRGASTLAGVLGELVPDLAQVLGEAPHVSADLDAADARRRLHRAVIRLISDTASYRPVVLAIDDLQWADRDTLLLLSELLTVSLRNVLVVGAHRAGEFDADSAGFTAESLRNMELSPLSPEDVEELLAAVSGRVVELGDVAAEFHHRTGGNPLQVRQLLYRAQREGALTRPPTTGGASWDLRVLTSIEVTATAARVPRPLPRSAAPSRPGGVEFAHVSSAASSTSTTLPPRPQSRRTWSPRRSGRPSSSACSKPSTAVAGGSPTRSAATPDTASAMTGWPRRRGSACPKTTNARRISGSVDGWSSLGDDRLFEAARHIGIGGQGLADDAERIRFVEVLRRAARKARAQASFPLALQYCRRWSEPAR